jgi:subtilase family protein
MPERPLLILPRPTLAERQPRHGGAGTVAFPSRERQAERLTPRFERLRRALDARRTELVASATGAVPEEVIVLEVVGDVQNFLRAVRKVVGLEWLGEVEVDDLIADDDFHDTDRRKALGGRLYLIFSDQQALNQMTSLWTTWEAGRSLPQGFAPWAAVFGQLRDLRPWDVRDRLLETGVLDDWRERESLGQERIPVEIELWYRDDAARRVTAERRVRDLVAAAQGQVLSAATMDEIAHHSLIAELPIQAVRQVLAAPDLDLVRCEQVQFFRAVGQAFVPMILVDTSFDDGAVGGPAKTIHPPVAALLDGLPIQNHRRLVGRLIVDDPDAFETDYPATERFHGTAMASLILHGDIGKGEPPLSRPLYVRPVMRPNPRDLRDRREEGVPDRVPIVDLFHRALRRIKEGDQGQPPTAPTVEVVNLSIGIRDRPFDRIMSPLARLVDWAAWKYRLLILVSAGNRRENVSLPMDPAAFRRLQPEQRQAELLRGLAAMSRLRRLLAPAEAVNALTIGSVHADSAGPAIFVPGFDPFPSPDLPSPFNAHGLGYRRSVKPDILVPGGRAVMEESLNTPPPGTTVLTFQQRTRPPGQKVACPGPNTGDLDRTCHTIGTSNATAIATRVATQLYDVLEELRESPGGDLIERVPRAIWLKALLVHGAEWGPGFELVAAALKNENNSRTFKEYVARFVGYGAIEPSRVVECTPHRVTGLSGGELQDGEAHIHQFPLPPSLIAKTGRRRLTITLAWLSPINPRHRGWRRAQLWFTPPEQPLQVKRQQVDWHAVQRGTVQHEILDGDRAAVFVDGNTLDIAVNCREDAGDLTEAVPYALAVTLEVAEEIGVVIYEEILERVLARVTV